MYVKELIGMKGAKDLFAAAFAAAMSSPLCIQAFALSPNTGNTESKTYVWVLAVAGVLVVGAVIAGIFTKKKK